MVDATSSQVMYDGERYALVKFVNLSDGTGETNVLKVDVSSLNPDSRGHACTGVRIDYMWFGISGMQVILLWEATVNVVAWILTSLVSQQHDWTLFSGITNNAGAGKTGNILFSTVGSNVGDTYCVMMRLVKEYNS